MSSWQRLQESDSMKNLLGIFCLPYTCAELGKNEPSGPSPSPFIVSGGMVGFSMRLRVCQLSRTYRAAQPIPASMARQNTTRSAPAATRDPIGLEFEDAPALNLPATRSPI